jgi:hypothetical protein
VAEIRSIQVDTSHNGDVWHRASTLIDGFGNEAPTHAARKALAMVASGNHEGYLLWLRILQAVDWLLENKKTTSLVA